jgi:hypothetical protein
MQNTPVMVRTSERTQFTKCRQSWWWSYKEEREPIEQWSKALVFGDMVHRCLAAYYIPETRKRRKRGPHPAATFGKLYDILDAQHKTFNIKVDDEFWVSARELGVGMMENYVTEWREADRNIVVLYPEMPFQIWIKDPDTGLPLCLYVGTTDALILNLATGKLGLFEHKTAAVIDISHLFLDEQASSYWCLVPKWLRENDIVKPTQTMDFMLYNFMRKALGDDRPKNAQGQYLNQPSIEVLSKFLTNTGMTKDAIQGLKRDQLAALVKRRGQDPVLLGEVSKVQPSPLFKRELVYRGEIEQANTYQRIVEQVREMNLVRTGKMPHYKSPSKECSFCSWRDLCELHETGSDWKEMKRIATRKWSPYAQHIWDIDLDS